MNKLKGLLVYLAGSIDLSPDFGYGWREEVKNALKKEKFGIGLLSPLEKPIQDGKEDEHDLRRQWRAEGKYDLLAEKMRYIRSVDLRLVDRSDFVIVRLDSTRVTGTLEELFAANRIKRPVLVWADQEYIADWMYGTIPYKYFFSSLDDLISYLRKVNNGEEDDNKRWIFFDWSKVEYV